MAHVNVLIVVYHIYSSLYKLTIFIQWLIYCPFLFIPYFTSKQSFASDLWLVFCFASLESGFSHWVHFLPLLYLYHISMMLNKCIFRWFLFDVTTKAHKSFKYPKVRKSQDFKCQHDTKKKYKFVRSWIQLITEIFSIVDVAS